MHGLRYILSRKNNVKVHHPPNMTLACHFPLADDVADQDIFDQVRTVFLFPCPRRPTHPLDLKCPMLFCVVEVVVATRRHDRLRRRLRDTGDHIATSDNSSSFTATYILQSLRRVPQDEK
jgi:hypothetical protein